MSTGTSSISSSVRDALLAKIATFQSRTNGGSSSSSSSSSGPSSESDAELVLRLILDSGRYSSEVQVQSAVEEYIGGKPLAYITNLHTFGNLTLVVRPPVYIPRVETEQWVLLLADSILSTVPSSVSRPIKILDLCSGSGCIPLLLASCGQGRIHVVGLDVDDRALAVARENADRNGLGEVARFERLDLFEDTDVEGVREKLGGFDMVVSNPPYVSSEDMRTVEGKWHEGKFALQGKLKGASTTDDSVAADNDDGYSFYRRIHAIYTSFLLPPSERVGGIPKLVLEVGAKQSGPVQEIYKDEGRLEVYKETERRRDVGAPKLEIGDMVGTERSVWIYDQGQVA